MAMRNMAAGGMPKLVSNTAYSTTSTVGYSPTMGGFTPVEQFMSEATMADVVNTSFRPAVLPRGPIGGAAPMAQRQLRYVKQFLTDRDDNIPLKDRVLYESEVFLTDESERELQFRVPVMDLLTKHNEKRVKFRDKAFKEKEVFLEPARIDDLILTTITVYNI